MRSSRISKETSKLFSRSSGSAAAVAALPILPRRSTRSSLARFSYGDGSAPASVKPELETADLSLGSDIEDAIMNNTTRKRKRTTIVRGGAGRPAAVIKTEMAKVTTEEATSTIITNQATSGPKQPARRARKPAHVSVDAATGETTAEPPSDWEEMYEVVRAMRAPGGAAANAAVDTMGCERLADPGASARDRRFHTLVALMLSSQTKDTVNAVAMRRLQTELPPHEPAAPPGLNLENMLAVDPDLLNQMIWQVGFHNNKTKYLKQAAEILRDKWGGDVPDTIEGLTSLPGVGPKMGYLCLAADNGWARTEGIGVDVHVHRITNLWGWNQTKTPEATRLALQAWLPRDRWREINTLLVGLGQAVCLPVGRRCGDCELGVRGLCRAADRGKVAEGRRRRELVVKTEVKAEEVKTEVKAEVRTKVKEEPLGGDSDDAGADGAVSALHAEGVAQGVKKEEETDVKGQMDADAVVKQKKKKKKRRRGEAGKPGGSSGNRPAEAEESPEPVATPERTLVCSPSPPLL